MLITLHQIRAEMTISPASGSANKTSAEAAYQLLLKTMQFPVVLWNPNQQSNQMQFAVNAF